jgi:hypothetical protein
MSCAKMRAKRARRKAKRNWKPAPQAPLNPEISLHQDLVEQSCLAMKMGLASRYYSEMAKRRLFREQILGFSFMFRGCTWAINFRFDLDGAALDKEANIVDAYQSLLTVLNSRTYIHHGWVVIADEEGRPNHRVYEASVPMGIVLTGWTCVRFWKDKEGHRWTLYRSGKYSLKKNFPGAPEPEGRRPRNREDFEDLSWSIEDEYPELQFTNGLWKKRQTGPGAGEENPKGEGS